MSRTLRRIALFLLLCPALSACLSSTPFEPSDGVRRPGGSGIRRQRQPLAVVAPTVTTPDQQ